ncbi:bifunctional UDP-N-acetylglucosamine diphosphorylase/glucosamine-1-phosphate N-acetyltransferase GlmU [Mesorhizobium australicum]|uniref:Bifunctional protein GlmU n=1 Tax=Mesorhizobium australicum TaxID=536018 RepID=A0A1X7PBF1_9HYPH|nr:bifunctional UDP-N-acetylglucosamine diphosphorylase/glucosamine-1-phosphate N-acetyltransferase GlmU [Mesorhizobium australicum]SMH47948.1 UDP-N-acetylglucosamine pyrophosphorylase /glucosamine-1-phosphate N-acetyltransferase [Mesorhizobium australicum]
MSDRSCLTIILAAGEGTRMKSAMPKVLHEIAGLPMVAHVAKAAIAAGGTDVAIVVGRGGEAVRKAVTPFAAGAESFEQVERLGTAHAVLAARAAIARGYDDVLVMFGDTPLIAAAPLAAARKLVAEGNAVAVIGFRTDVPAGYGRLIEKDGRLVAIREDKDCSPEERKIGFCNGGLMAIDGREALALLDAVGNANAKGEYYLTDIVEIANARGLKVTATEADYENLLGINNRAELAEAEAIWQKRARRETMLSGVTMIAPETVFLSHDTEIGADTVIEPNVVFGPGAKIASGVTVHAFSHIEGATVATGSSIGPFARLRPGAELQEKARVGNFVEIKKAVVGPGAKVNHLTYIGDAEIGAGANIGAGTITCNYDGYNKHLTRIGAGAFIGSNSALVAPVSVGDNAYVASGSVITENVPDDGLAFGRARQETKPGRAKALRERYAAIKSKSRG